MEVLGACEKIGCAPAMFLCEMMENVNITLVSYRERRHPACLCPFFRRKVLHAIPPLFKGFNPLENLFFVGLIIVLFTFYKECFHGRIGKTMVP